MSSNVRDLGAITGQADPFRTMEGPVLQVPPSPGGSTAGATMGPLRTGALSAWRTYHASKTLLFVLAVFILPSFLIPQPYGPIALTSFTIALPFMLMMLAQMEADPKQESFWRGLGGPAWARLLGSMLVHAVMLGLPIAALSVWIIVLPESLGLEVRPLERLAGVGAEYRPVLLLAWLLFLAGFYTSTIAARTFATRLEAAAGPVVFLLAFGSSLLIGELWIRSLPAPLAWVLHLAPVVLLALGLAFQGEARRGSWGASVSTRPRRWRVLATFIAWVLSWGIEAAWSWGPLPPGYRAPIESPDGQHAWYINERPRGGRAWRLGIDGSSMRAPVLGVTMVKPGPMGSALLWTTSEERPSDIFLLSTGGMDRCQSSSFLDWRWRPDGQVAAVRRESDWLLLDQTGSCRTIPFEELAWVGQVLVGSRDGRLVTASGEDLGVDDVFQVLDDPAAPWVIAGPEESRQVLRVRLDGRKLLVGEAGAWRALVRHGSDVCGWREKKWWCWDDQGNPFVPQTRPDFDSVQHYWLRGPATLF